LGSPLRGNISFVLVFYKQVAPTGANFAVYFKTKVPVFTEALLNVIILDGVLLI
jgi:hypothetical protein